MDVIELAELYRQANDARDETVRQILANAVAQAAATRAALDEARAATVGKGGATDGPHVRRLQLLLAANGADIRVDGKFGPKTEAALTDFQTRTGLKADGVAGPKTWARFGHSAGDDGAAAALTAKANAELQAFAELSKSAVQGGDLAAAETLAAEATAAEALGAEAIAAETLAAEANDTRFSAEPVAVEAAVSESAAAEGVAAISAALETFVAESARPQG